MGAIGEKTVGAGTGIHCSLGETVKAVLGEIQKFQIQKQIYLEAELSAKPLRRQVVGIWKPDPASERVSESLGRTQPRGPLGHQNEMGLGPCPALTPWSPSPELSAVL